MEGRKTMKTKIFVGLVILLATVACFPISEVPEIYSIFPDRGPVGTQVTISGTRFGDINSDKVALYFGGVSTPTENIISWSESRIVAIVPEDAVTGRVVVEVNGRKSRENIIFEVLEFAPIEISACVAVALSDGSVRFIRTDSERGLYIDSSSQYHFSLDSGDVTIEQLIAVKNSSLLLASGWIDSDGEVKYLLYGWRSFTDAVTTPAVTPGLIVDGVKVDGEIYLLDYLDRSVELFDPAEWSVVEKFSLAGDMPFSHPFRIFYSTQSSSFVIFTKPIFDTQNGEMLIYSRDFQLKESFPLPFMQVYDVFYPFSSTFVVTGIQGENSLYFLIPEDSPEELFSQILTYNDLPVSAGGFYPDPFGKGLLVSDFLNANLLIYPYGANGGVLVVNPDYGTSITSPSIVRSIPDFEYVFVKSRDDQVVVIDTSIGAVYGAFQFPDNIIDMEAGIEGGE